MRWLNGRCIRLLDKKQSVVKCRLSPFYVVRLKLALAGYLSTNELKYCTFVGQPEKFRGGGGGGRSVRKKHSPMVLAMPLISQNYPNALNY